MPFGCLFYGLVDYHNDDVNFIAFRPFAPSSSRSLCASPVDPLLIIMNLISTWRCPLNDKVELRGQPSGMNKFTRRRLVATRVLMTSSIVTRATIVVAAVAAAIIIIAFSPELPTGRACWLLVTN